MRARKKVIKRRKRIRPKKRRQIMIKIYFYSSLIFAGLLFASLSYLSFLPALNINTLSVTGPDKNLAWNMQKFLHEKIFEKEFLFFSPYNSILIDKDALLAQISYAFPEVANLKEKSKSSNEFAVEFEKRKTRYIFDNKTSCYKLDENLFFFKKAVCEYKKNDVPILQMTTSMLDIESTNTLLRARPKKEIADSVKSIEKEMDALQLKPVKILYEKDGNITLFADSMFFKLRVGGESNLRYFKIAREKELIKPQNLQYVDLRFDSRIYYKEKKYEKESME